MVYLTVVCLPNLCSHVLFHLKLMSNGVHPKTEVHLYNIHGNEGSLDHSISFCSGKRLDGNGAEGAESTSGNTGTLEGKKVAYS